MAITYPNDTKTSIPVDNDLSALKVRANGILDSIDSFLSGLDISLLEDAPPIDTFGQGFISWGQPVPEEAQVDPETGVPVQSGLGMGLPVEGAVQGPVDVVGMRTEVDGLSEKITGLEGKIVSVQGQVSEVAPKAILAEHKASQAISIANSALSKASKCAGSDQSPAEADSAAGTPSYVNGGHS